MIDTAALKNRILSLAMTGQVANNKKDVKQLFESLCVNAYKIDKNKISDKNYDLSELPFDIPDDWKWVWLGDIFQHNTGKALNSSNTEGTSLEYITTSNLYWDRFELEELKSMLFKDSEIDKCTIKKGDLLICEGGDIGRSAIWCEDYEMRIQNHIHRLRPYVDDICVRFYYYVMMYYKNNGLISGRGIGLQGLSSKRLHSILVPFPDIETQFLIAEKIDELFSVIDTIDELQQQYSSDLEILKSKIIDAGIQGKLTEQLPEDGTAEELYQQIQAEKAKLVRHGIIKKGKALQEIKDAEMPFDIPGNWKWVRIGEIFNLQAGKSIVTGTVSEEKTKAKPYECFGGNGCRGYVSEFNREGAFPIIGRQGALCGCINYASGKIYATEHAVVVDCLGICNERWAAYFLNALNLNQYATSVAQPGLAVSNIVKVLIPLPPYDEQVRIVDKLDKLLTMM